VNENIPYWKKQIEDLDGILLYLNNKLEELDAEKQFTLVSAMKYPDNSATRKCYNDHFIDLMKKIIPYEWDMKVNYDKRARLQELIALKSNNKEELQ
jgi:hypothetical protein